MRALLGMGLLSAAALMLQVTLTRIFSVAQFYHFAFLIVSLALLGFGASGSLLALWPRLRGRQLSAWYGLGFAVTTVLAYLFLNHKPFDSYSIAWDRSQVYLMIGNLLGLAIPFVFAGALIGLMLSHDAEHAGQIYGANLLGSAAGAIATPLLITWVGSARIILLAAVLGAGAAAVLTQSQRRVRLIASLMVLIGLGLMVVFPEILAVQPSPYKRLSQFRNIEAGGFAKIVATRQNAASQLDIVQSSTIHSAPGLSITYLGELPPQLGLLIDGDALLAVPQTSQIDPQLAEKLPAALAYAIRPNAEEVLILEPGGGMDAWAAIEMDVQEVTVVEPNALVYEALTEDLTEWYTIAAHPATRFVHAPIRSFAVQSDTGYDIVLRPLADNYRPISSGAFTLTENYVLTVEAFESYLDLLSEDGLLVVNSWLQVPPSESLRVLALLLEALDTDQPLKQLFVFRSFQTMTFIAKRTPFTGEEVDRLLRATEALRYDLVLAPEMPPGMINRFARKDEPIYHELMLEMVTTSDREAFYASYPFRIRPPTDDMPFFFHFFRWGQTPTIVENLGRNWQPFGGSGYFVLLALLIFAIVAAFIFILLPILTRQSFRQGLFVSGKHLSLRILAYFTAIGLAYLLVEVSLIQRYILILGEPTLAVATVIGVLLLTSGIGSILTDRLPWRPAMLLLVIFIALYPFMVNSITSLLLSLNLISRIGAVGLLITPIGLLMGIPFASGIHAMQHITELVPWAWAINGSASVISAVLAAILALSLGFTAVLVIGAGLYLVAASLAGFHHIPDPEDR